MTIPMLHRPLDQLVGPPDPATRYTSAKPNGVWLTPVGGSWLDAVVNPGEPGQPELLPWKRKNR